MSERRGRIPREARIVQDAALRVARCATLERVLPCEPASEADLAVMRLIDEIYLQWPFYGSRRMRDELEERGHTVNRKRVQRLMRQMGLRACIHGVNEPAGQGAQDLPLPAQGPAHRTPRTRLGQVTSATSRWPRGSCTWWQSWTGILDGCCHGGCRTPWMRTSVSRHWRKLYSALKRRRSSIPTKGPSSPVRRSPTCSRATPLRSARSGKGLMGGQRVRRASVA